jgi:hypothetical protein
MKRFLSALAAFVVVSSYGADVPGSYMRTANQLPVNSYEMMISPSYVMGSNGGAYLSAELRYQPYEAFAAGFGFGAGELGFNFGAHGVWNLLPHLQLVPRVAILGGAYFNRVAGANYFVVKMAPTVSHTFQADWGSITPYGAFALSPSFRLGQFASNQFSMKASLGSQFSPKGADGLQILTEISLGVLKSTYEIGVGISYPFAAL